MATPDTTVELEARAAVLEAKVERLQRELEAAVPDAWSWWQQIAGSFSDEKDARLDLEITNQILAFIKEHKAVSVVSVGTILGCPHEEAVDYREGENCPHCPYWADKDRWAGLVPE